MPARSEAEVAAAFAVERVERTRPVVTQAAGIFEHGIFAVAGGRQEDVARGPRRRAALHGGPVLCASQAVSTCPRAALAGGPRLCADGDDRGEQRRQTHSCPSAAKRPDERFC